MISVYYLELAANINGHYVFHVSIISRFKWKQKKSCCII